ncbi:MULTISPECIES: hypothetical protein [Thiorhodovibrio]|jgi:hypothetical protein|uniref:DUF2281 domain-containing protein n=1 Tax=Thiorhodovibrio frisius TaxID=631362 RepID=H8Z861_9GAMM|nr:MULTISPECIES: hypothetical protein [Thiorhodovibrio]EIC21010.1 hypothetical protein Thi970DRAFT_04692 [Thiorhodovibrio frisius]MBK5967985.1 hypothetical protein [Thiorhodovibrio winogradskyi]WPL11800.1 hypothetical protein Thiosp_01552 [Thiorhodovibrio litoralis]WPL22066.1 hypothetical protein Thiofri_02217 [Thiorhodovibrio frisius]
MQAIELETEIDENHEIHLKLPEDVKAVKARVVVLYNLAANENGTQMQDAQPLKLGLFRGQVQMSDDFDAPLPDELWLSGNP